MAITVGTRKTLWTRAHNECAFPSCLQELAFDSEAVEDGSVQVIIVGEEAHIRAQSPGGPRYEADYADVDGYENLMLMCPTHHSMIDANKGKGYSVKALLRMKKDHEHQQEQRRMIQGALRAYLGDRFAAENSVQFQQAELRGPSVDSMFVDVPLGCRRDGSTLATLLSRVADEAPGDTGELERTSGLVITGATQALLHPEWTGNAIVVGGPGQGKSTLLQYVCQFHRARRLGKAGYSADQPELARAGSTVRFPIRIDLRKYALWADQAPVKSRKRKKKRLELQHEPDSWPSLEKYLIEHIGQHTGAYDFTAQDLVLLLATEPVILALDGLDEVANLSTRARVVNEIVQMHGRLKVDAADLVILVATRPGASLRPLTSSGAFPLLHLQRLTQGLRIQYLRQWVEVSGLSPEAASNLKSTFMDSQHVPHVSELASYPMQLAILLHLLHRRQLLPQQRTELYSEYLKTFLDREQTENKEPLLKDLRRVVEDTHAYLGWYLQTKAEEGKSAGSITRDELRTLLRAYLTGQPKEQQLADDLYSAITDRVLCLVERDDAFEFEVQSLREYFAALHIYENLTPKGNGNSRDDGLNALLERPYWANTCRFFIGMLAKGEVRALIGNFTAVDKKVKPRPLMRSMAVAILNDRVYDGLTKDEIQGVVNFVLAGPGVVLAEDGALDPAGNPLRFRESAGRAQAVTHLKERLEHVPDRTMLQAVAKSLLAHAVPDDGLARWWREKSTPDSRWLETAAYLRLFTQLGTDQPELLPSAISTYDEPSMWRSDLLRIGGYAGDLTELTQIVFDDINSGAPTDADFWSSELNALLSNARTALGAAGSTPTEMSGSLAQLSSAIAVQLTESAHSLRSNPDPTSLADWDSYLRIVANSWGEGWVLSRALARVPETIDFSLLAARTIVPALSLAASMEADYRRYRSAPEWWRSHLASQEGGPPLMLAIVALLEHAYSTTLAAVATELDVAVRKLDSKQYRAVEHALRQDTVSYRARPLDLQEQLRLGRLNLTGQSLWLVWQIATDATREQMAGHLERELSDVLLSGTTNACPAITAAFTTRKLKTERFQGSRGALPEGGWADPTRIAAMTIATARSVLETPTSWPVELVQVAIDRLNTQAASRPTPLASVASDNEWFWSP